MEKSFFLVTFLKLLIIYHIILITFGLEQTLTCHFVWTSHLLGIPKGKRKKKTLRRKTVMAKCDFIFSVTSSSFWRFAFLTMCLKLNPVTCGILRG